VLTLKATEKHNTKEIMETTIIALI